MTEIQTSFAEGYRCALLVLESRLFEENYGGTGFIDKEGLHCLIREVRSVGRRWRRAPRIAPALGRKARQPDDR
jgi:hypothetical protein